MFISHFDAGRFFILRRNERASSSLGLGMVLPRGTGRAGDGCSVSLASLVQLQLVQPLGRTWCRAHPCGKMISGSTCCFGEQNPARIL